MSKIRKYWAVVVFAVLLGVIGMHGLGPNATQATPGSAPVTVTNTPLPVQGTVNAAQSGSWNVGITGNPGVTVTNANSQPVPTLAAGASLVTPMGQRPSNHVVLSSFGSHGCPTWARVGPDGSVSAFTIPAGQDLVITDVDWFAFNTDAPPGTLNALDLRLAGSVVLQAFVLADPSGELATQQHLTSGIVMAVLPDCLAGGSNTTDQVVIRGYLIPAS